MHPHFQRSPGAFWAAGTGLFACALSALCALPASADADRFAYGYSWFTPSKGEVEAEVRHVQPTSGRTWQDSVSAEVGVTDRYMIEPYVVFNRSGGFRDIPGRGQADADGDEGGKEGTGNAVFDPILNGGAYRYGGFRVEQRYRFGNYGFKKLLTAGYLEYEDIRGSSREVEGKLIFQYDPHPQATFVANLITENPVQHGGSTGWGYTLSGAYLADPKNDRYWFGAEAFGNWSGNQHWIGPSVGGYLGSQFRLIGTYGKQYRGSGGDQLQFVLSRDMN